MKYFTCYWCSLRFRTSAFASVTITSPNPGPKSFRHFFLSRPLPFAHHSPSRPWAMPSTTAHWPVVQRIVDRHPRSVYHWRAHGMRQRGLEGAQYATPWPQSRGSGSHNLVPADALVFKRVQALRSWQGVGATRIDGTASGQTKIVAWPSLSGDAREFVTQFTNYGDERYWVVFGHNTEVTNFLYDGWVYVARRQALLGTSNLI